MTDESAKAAFLATRLYLEAGRERDALRVERDAMRAVVEAAQEIIRLDRENRSTMPNAVWRDLVDAVDDLAALDKAK